MKDEIKAIIIDPYLRTISATTIKNDLEGLKHAIGDHWIELVRINDKNDLYVDEEGLFKENQEFFVITGNNGSFPLAGKGVIVGNTPTGNQRDTNLTVADIWGMVEFHTREEMQQFDWS